MCVLRYFLSIAIMACIIISIKPVSDMRSLKRHFFVLVVTGHPALSRQLSAPGDKVQEVWQKPTNVTPVMSASPPQGSMQKPRPNSVSSCTSSVSSSMIRGFLCLSTSSNSDAEETLSGTDSAWSVLPSI